MKQGLIALALILVAGSVAGAQEVEPVPIPNPGIDMDGHLVAITAAAELRESRRLTANEFIRMSREPGTIVLDARSRDKFDELHVEGAINLPFPDITVASLAEILPDKAARILIYCNNNFENAEGPFPTKIARASLNLSTYVTLYEYGYLNVFELGPLLDIHTTRIPFAGSSAASISRSGNGERSGADIDPAPITLVESK